MKVCFFINFSSFKPDVYGAQPQLRLDVLPDTTDARYKTQTYVSHHYSSQP